MTLHVRENITWKIIITMSPTVISYRTLNALTIQNNIQHYEFKIN